MSWLWRIEPLLRERADAEQIGPSAERDLSGDVHLPTGRCFSNYSTISAFISGRYSWPVCEWAATSDQVHAALVEALGPLSESERAAMFGGAARNFCDLPEEDEVPG
jgi:hypothetical protein